MLELYGVDTACTRSTPEAHPVFSHPSALKLAISIQRMKAQNALLVKMAVIPHSRKFQMTAQNYGLFLKLQRIKME